MIAIPGSFSCLFSEVLLTVGCAVGPGFSKCFFSKASSHSIWTGLAVLGPFPGLAFSFTRRGFLFMLLCFGSYSVVSCRFECRPGFSYAPRPPVSFMLPQRIPFSSPLAPPLPHTLHPPPPSPTPPFPFTHSLTHSLHSLHSLTHSFAHPLHSLTCSLGIAAVYYVEGHHAEK